MGSWPFVPTEGPVIEIVRSEGNYLYTSDGAEILDASGGAIVSNIGWGRKEVCARAAAAMESTTFVLPTLATPERLQLVEMLLSKWLPKGLTRVFFASGGSEAVDAALRLARQHFVCKGEPSRWKVIGRKLSYHGITLSTLSVGGHDDRRAGFEIMFNETPRISSPYPLRRQKGEESEDFGVACANELETAILHEGPETVAAFIAEPIIGASGGAIVPPDGYWPRVREICDRYGVLLIADEVMTGFGRTGTKFGVDHWNLSPDILVAGKGLSGGYAPLSLVATTDHVIQPLAEKQKPLMYYTYGGHPACCAAAIATLEILENENLIERCRAMEAKMAASLAKLKDHPNVAEVRGKGLLWAVELVKDKETLELFPREAMVSLSTVIAAAQKGVLMYPGGTGAVRDIVLAAPAFTIDESEIDRIGSVLYEAVETVTSLHS